MKLLVSACLLGLPCRYDGKAKEFPLEKLAEQHEIVPFCPECYGGLPIPRAPSEITGDRVISSVGKDVTAQYRRGAESAVLLCRKLNIRYALLKAKSPSCGVGKIYDGSFSKTLIPGDGITAAALKNSGVAVYSEEDIPQLLQDLKSSKESAL